MAAMGYILIEHRHLRPADTGRYIAQTIIITYYFMLVVGIAFARLSRVPHDVFT